MKFLVMSDNHGSKEEIDIVLKRHSDIDTIFHCGDVEFPKKEIDKRNIIAVNGNSPFDREFEDELILTIQGKKFLIVHGHQYDVKMSPMTLKSKANHLGVDFCLFGHTHVIHYENYKGIIVINPGSIHRPYSRIYQKSYCVHDNGKTTFYNLSGDVMYEFDK